MNIVLFTSQELSQGLPSGDPRIDHVRDVLRCGPGDSFDIGLIDGPRGKATLKLLDDGRAVLDYDLGDDPPPLHPITLIAGMPRPQTARRLLREMTALGVERIWFSMTDRSEKGYASSKLWSTGEYQRHLISGAEQAFCTRIPEVRRFDSIEQAIKSLDHPDDERIALDNYESTSRLVDLVPASERTILAIGAERGWSGSERDLLRNNGFGLANLGDRVLRVETAAIAAVSIALTFTGSRRAT